MVLQTYSAHAWYMLPLIVTTEFHRAQSRPAGRRRMYTLRHGPYAGRHGTTVLELARTYGANGRKPVAIHVRIARTNYSSQQLSRACGPS